MSTCFVDEFNRLLADATFEALLADQGMEALERRRRGSRRAFEPPPPLYMSAPQLLEGIVKVCEVWKAEMNIPTDAHIRRGEDGCLY